MISRIFTVAALAAGAGLVCAQSVVISSACQSALVGIAASPQAACLNPSALLSLLLAGNSSIITPVDQWVTGLCSRAPCSNSSLSAVVTNITAGCSTDLSNIGIPSNSTQVLITTVEGLYPFVREIACLEDTSANQHCVTETLRNLQSVSGLLTLNTLPGIITKLFSSNSSFPSNVACSNCSKQTYNVLNQMFPGAGSSMSASLQSQCGSNFTDGSAASGIAELAFSTSSSAALGASSLMSGGALAGVAISSLVTVLSGFVLLA